MSGHVSLETQAPPLSQSVTALRIEQRNDLLRDLAPEKADQTVHSPHVQAVISQVLLNAESLIASVLGVRANEVGISVNVGRYEF